VLRRVLVLRRKPGARREFAAASATVISRSCSCPRTSIFAHRSPDRSNASAYSKARQQGIVSPARLAHRPAGEQQCKRRKPPTEFASPSHPRGKCDVPPKHGLTNVTSLPNLVTTGQNLGQIRSGRPKRWDPARVPSRFRDHEQGGNGGDETISAAREVLRKHWPPRIPFTQTTGLDHVGIGPEPHLPRVPQARPSRHFNTGRKAMTEVVTAVLAFISIGIFLAHAFDAYRLR
jgi:hypothetical protein